MTYAPYRFPTYLCLWCLQNISSTFRDKNNHLMECPAAPQDFWAKKCNCTPWYIISYEHYTKIMDHISQSLIPSCFVSPAQSQPHLHIDSSQPSTSVSHPADTRDVATCTTPRATIIPWHLHNEPLTFSPLQSDTFNSIILDNLPSTTPPTRSVPTGYTRTVYYHHPFSTEDNYIYQTLSPSPSDFSAYSPLSDHAEAGSSHRSSPYESSPDSPPRPPPELLGFRHF